MNSINPENGFSLPDEGGRVGFLGINYKGKEGSKENTGNYLHGYAARHIVGEYRNLHVSFLNDEKVEEARSELTHIAFVAATTIAVNKVEKHAGGHTRLADSIEKLKLPVVVFGARFRTLGLQAPLAQR